jgi:hypothetical protein
MRHNPALGIMTQFVADSPMPVVQRVVPFWPGKGDAIYFCDQHMILMQVERMVRE